MVRRDHLCKLSGIWSAHWYGAATGMPALCASTSAQAEQPCAGDILASIHRRNRCDRLPAGPLAAILVAAPHPAPDSPAQQRCPAAVVRRSVPTSTLSCCCCGSSDVGTLLSLVGVVVGGGSGGSNAGAAIALVRCSFDPRSWNLQQLPSSLVKGHLRIDAPHSNANYVVDRAHSDGSPEIAPKM